MKLNQNQLDNYISKNQISNFYWLNSEDGFLLQDSLKKIRKLANKNDFNERLVYHVDNNHNWQDIINTIQTPSLFSQNQIIELYFINKISASEQKELVTIAELIQQYPHTICIVNYPFRIDAKSLKTKWMSSLDQHGVVITLWPLNNNDYIQWLKSTINKYNIKFEDFNYFCQKTMGNPGAAMQTLYKIKLQGLHTVSKQELAQILSEHANYNIFDLVENYLLGNIKQCFIILKTLKANHTAPLLIIWSIRNELALLAEILEDSINNKKNVQQVLNNLKLWQNKKNTLSKALGRMTLDTVYKSLNLIAKIELTIKTENNNIYTWQQLEELLLLANNMVLFNAE